MLARIGPGNVHKVLPSIQPCIKQLTIGNILKIKTTIVIVVNFQGLLKFYRQLVMKKKSINLLSLTPLNLRNCFELYFRFALLCVMIIICFAKDWNKYIYFWIEKGREKQNKKDIFINLCWKCLSAFCRANNTSLSTQSINRFF